MDMPKVSDSNASFMRSNLDKGLLMFAVAGLLMFTFHASHHDMDNNSGVTQFTMNLTGQAFAALLTLITIGSKKGGSDLPDVPGKVTETVHQTIETKTEIPPPPKEGE